VAENKNAGKKKFHGTDLLTNNCKITGFLKTAKAQEVLTKTRIEQRRTSGIINHCATTMLPVLHQMGKQ